MTARIYVACLASYNAGRLYGKWIDASTDTEDMQTEIAEMLRGSPYPNVMVQCPHCEGEGTPDDSTCPDGFETGYNSGYITDAIATASPDGAAITWRGSGKGDPAIFTGSRDGWMAVLMPMRV